MSSQYKMGTEQQYCLKWNNHRSTILSVFDTLLEEESLVDVTLSAEGQFLRAHRVILSACSPYFRTLFRSTFLNDKHPVVFMKDVVFENLKALVEYMYKGEANVPQHMLPSFIRTAESLQIRGLAEGATRQYENTSEILTPSHHSTPICKSEKKDKSTGGNNSPSTPGGILAARLAKMVDPPLFDFPHHNKKRKSEKDVTTASSKCSPTKTKLKTSGSGATGVVGGGGPPAVGLTTKSSNVLPTPSLPPPPPPPTFSLPPPITTTNNNFGDEEGVLKIDEDADVGKENRGSPSIHTKEDADDDIVDLDTANGVDSEEEEPSMPAPGSSEIHGTTGGIINPWTGEDMSAVITDDRDDSSGIGGDSLAPMYPSLISENSILSRSELSGDSSGASRRSIGALDTSLAGDNSSGLSAAAAAAAAAVDRDPLTNKYACARCGRSYLHQATLVRHQRYECGISASYPCSLCGRKFKRRDVLKGHMEKCVNKSTAAAVAAAAAASAVNTVVPFPTSLSS